MKNFEQEDFSRFGKSFQERLVKALFYDRSFHDQMSDVFDQYFLEKKYLRIFIEKLSEYREEYKSHPSIETMATILKTRLDEETEVIQKQVKDFFVRVATNDEIEDIDYIKTTALDFCKKQKLKEAIMKSASLLKSLAANPASTSF